VKGDVAFGSGVLVRGSVRVENRGSGQARIEDGAVLDKDTVLGDAAAA
jgi:hypothetical protein